MPKHLQTGSLKTINGEALEGAGDIVITGGTGGSGSGSTELPAYSTDEVLTAQRWVDGRPIYSKAVELTSFALTADVWTYVSHGINNLSEITSVSGSYADSSGNIGSFPFLGSAGCNVGYSVEATQVGFIAVNAGRTITGYFVMEYTKTTDTSSSPVALIGGGSSIIIAKTTSTQSSNSTTLTPINELTVPVQANTIYRVDCFVTFRSSSTAAGAGIGFIAPTDSRPTIEFTTPTVTGASATALHLTTPVAAHTTNVSIVPSSTPTANTDMTVHIQGLLQTTSAGDFVIQFRTEDATGTITIQTNSILVVEKIG